MAYFKLQLLTQIIYDYNLYIYINLKRVSFLDLNRLELYLECNYFINCVLFFADLEQKSKIHIFCVLYYISLITKHKPVLRPMNVHKLPTVFFFCKNKSYALYPHLMLF